jgi:hypothetical protein
MVGPGSSLPIGPLGFANSGKTSCAAAVACKFISWRTIIGYHFHSLIFLGLIHVKWKATIVATVIPQHLNKL